MQIENTTESSLARFLALVELSVLQSSLQINLPLLSSLEIVSEILSICVNVDCIICFELARNASISYSNAPDITKS